MPRISDIYAALPAITGKMELEYEGELVGAAKIAEELVANAAADTFEDRAGDVDELLDEVVDYFETGGVLQLTDDAEADVMLKAFAGVSGLTDVVRTLELECDDPAHTVAACELVLESLVANRRISRNETGRYGRAKGRRPGPGGGQNPFQGPLEV